MLAPLKIPPWLPSKPGCALLLLIALVGCPSASLISHDLKRPRSYPFLVWYLLFDKIGFPLLGWRPLPSYVNRLTPCSGKALAN